MPRHSHAGSSYVPWKQIVTLAIAEERIPGWRIPEDGTIVGMGTSSNGITSLGTVEVNLYAGASSSSAIASTPPVGGSAGTVSRDVSVEGYPVSAGDVIQTRIMIDGDTGAFDIGEITTVITVRTSTGYATGCLRAKPQDMDPLPDGVTLDVGEGTWEYRGESIGEFGVPMYAIDEV